MKKAFLTISLLSALFSFGQKGFNKLNFTRGQKLEVVTNMNVSTVSLMGPASGTIILADIYTVNEATANTTTLVKEPKQIKINFTVASQQINLDTDNPKDLNGMLGQPVKDAMAHKPVFTIDATGRIIAVEKDESKKPNESGAGGMMGMMLPGMNLASAAPQEGNPSLFQALPNREISIGDTWTDSLQADGNQNVTVYKVKDINEKEIVLDAKSEGTTISAREAMGMKVDLNAAFRSASSIVIDKATGIVKQITGTTTTETTMNMGGREVTSTAKTTTVTNVRTL